MVVKVPKSFPQNFFTTQPNTARISCPVRILLGVRCPEHTEQLLQRPYSTGLVQLQNERGEEKRTQSVPRWDKQEEGSAGREEEEDEPEVGRRNPRRNSEREGGREGA